MDRTTLYSFIAILVMLSILSFFAKSVYESFATTNTPFIYFVPQNELFDVVEASSYFQNMTPYDLKIRGAESKQLYAETYVRSWEPFDLQQKQDVTDMIQEIAQYIQGYQISKLPWKLVKISSSLENGYPHTLADVIVLSDAFFTLPKDRQTSILLHEQVHVYQRKYPQRVEKLYDEWGFRKVSKIPFWAYHNVRNNPDLQGYYTYKNKLLLQLYDKNASNLAHSMPVMIDMSTELIESAAAHSDFPSYVHQLEHPNELMASLVPFVIFGPLKTDRWFDILKSWMQTNF